MNNQNVEKIEPTGIFTNYIYKAIPLAFDESMSYYETLCGLLDYLKNTIIPTINNNADVITEYETKFIELKSFVDNYFDNLDVQNEINNKLDEMVEDGTMDALLNTNLTGSLSDLETTDKTNLVSAINEINTKASNNATNIGTLSNLNTTEKSNLVSAINEINTKASNNATNIGTLSNLNTTEKSNLVGAINEIDSNVEDIDDKFNYSSTEQRIGKWIDNSVLYRKIISVNNLTPDNDNIKTIAHNISYFNKVISLKCIANNGVDTYFDFNNYTWYDENDVPANINSTCHVFIDDTNIYVIYEGTHILNYISEAYFILEYIKYEN